MHFSKLIFESLSRALSRDISNWYDKEDLFRFDGGDMAIFEQLRTMMAVEKE